MEVICSKCNARYKIPANKLPPHKASMACKKCGHKIIVDPGDLMSPGENPQPAPQTVPTIPVAKETDMRFKEYKVMHVAEGGCGTLLLGSSGVPLKKMEAALNEAAADGWQVVFQVIEAKRFLLFWTREAVLITLGR